MSNIIYLSDYKEEALIKQYKKHLDLAEVYWEMGDEVAYQDHVKIAESYLERIHEVVATNS